MTYLIVETDGNGKDVAFVGPDFKDRFAAKQVTHLMNEQSDNSKASRHFKVVEDGYVIK